MQLVLISKFAKKFDLANLKSTIDKLDIEKLKNVPSNLRNLKSKVNKLDVDKLVTIPVDLTLVRIGFSRVVFTGKERGGGDQFDPPSLPSYFKEN